MIGKIHLKLFIILFITININLSGQHLKKGINYKLKYNSTQHSLSDNDLIDIKSKGFNFIHILIEPATSIESERELIDYYSSIINSKKDVLDSLNLKIVLSFHKYPLIKNDFNQTSEKFWNNKKMIQDSHNAILLFLKKIDISKEILFGIEYISEPLIRDEYNNIHRVQNLSEIQLQLYNKVREINKNIYFLITPGPGGHVNGYKNYKPLKGDKIIYNFHFFSPKKYVQSNGEYNYPGYIDFRYWNKKALIKQMKPVINFRDKFNTSVLLGSFSASFYAKNRDLYLRHINEICDSLNIPHSFHLYNGHKMWRLSE